MNDECPVCLVQKEIVSFPTCSHGVCKECYKILDKYQITTCPLCRSSFKDPSTSEPDVVRRRRRNLSRIEHLKRRQIIKGKQRRSRSKKEGRSNKLHGTNYF